MSAWFVEHLTGYNEKGLHTSVQPLLRLVTPTGLEPVACSSGGCRSIQLSYGAVFTGILAPALGAVKICAAAPLPPECRHHRRAQRELPSILDP